VQELLSQHRALQSLIARNRDAPVEAVQAAAAACGGPTPLQLPFIIIQVLLERCCCHSAPRPVGVRLDRHMLRGTGAHMLASLFMAILVDRRQGTKPRWSCSCRTTPPKCTSTFTSAPCIQLASTMKPALRSPCTDMSADLAITLWWSCTSRAAHAMTGLRGLEAVLLSCLCTLRSTPFKIHGDDTLLKLMDLSAKPSPLLPLGSRPASGKRRRSSPAPMGQHSDDH
jgi:hypothetical protein